MKKVYKNPIIKKGQAQRKGVKSTFDFCGWM